MIEWNAVVGSTRITAEAYDAGGERILVRFPNGTEWWYSACPADVWTAFTAPGQSRGEFIAQVLNFKPNGRYTE
jgi:uncharacterized protein RhaS with RHS repeats